MRRPGVSIHDQAEGVVTTILGRIVTAAAGFVAGRMAKMDEIRHGTARWHRIPLNLVSAQLGCSRRWSLDTGGDGVISGADRWFPEGRRLVRETGVYDNFTVAGGQNVEAWVTKRRSAVHC